MSATYQKSVEYSSGQPVKRKQQDRSKSTSDFQLGKTAAKLEQQKTENEQTAQMNAVQAQQLQSAKMELDTQMNQMAILLKQMESQSSANQIAPPPMPGTMQPPQGGMPPEMSGIPPMGGIPPQSGMPPMGDMPPEMGGMPPMGGM